MTTQSVRAAYQLQSLFMYRQDAQPAYFAVPVAESTTLGQVWSDLVAQHGADLDWQGKYPTFVQLSAGPPDPGNGNFLFLRDSHVRRPGQPPTWQVPWPLLRIADLPHLYPHPLEGDPADLHIVWCSYAGVGNGGAGMDWSQLPDLLQFLRDHWPATAVGTYVLARDAIQHASSDTRAIVNTVKKAADTLARRLPRWEEQGADIHTVGTVAGDSRLSEQERAQMLDIPVEEVQDVRIILEPESEGIPPEIYGGPYSALQLSQLADDPTQPPERMHVCACNKSWCAVQGAILATPGGVKVGLAGRSDHFTLDEEALADFDAAVTKWQENRPS